MRIVLDLPDWCDDQAIRIIAGQELVAKKMPWEDRWKVKTVRCNNCGECCMMLSPGDMPHEIDDEGKCSKLVKEGGQWLCSLRQKTWVPLCCVDDPLKENSPNCCIEYEEQ